MFQQGFGIVGSAIALLIACGVGLALVRGSYSKARIEALRGDNGDLRDRVTDLENSEKRLEERCNHLDSENKLLKQMVLQRAKVDEVATVLGSVAGKLDEHHDEAMVAWSAILNALQGSKK